MPALPVSISIEPTTSCNLRCPECPSGLRSFTRPTGMMPFDLFQRLIDELAPTLSHVNFYFQGEPYLHPRFLEMVCYAASKRIYTTTSTNAHYLDDDRARNTVLSGLDRLVVSIDGVDQKAYSSYRKGGRLSKVLEGTRNIVRWKKHLGYRTPYVIFQFLVTGENISQLDAIRALARDMEVDDLALKTIQVYDYQKGSPLIPSDERYSRYKKQSNGSYVIKNNFYNRCWKMWHSCVITWDGKIVPCCFDKDAHFVLGELAHQSLRNIWRGKKYQAFRSSVFRHRDTIEMCKNCTEGTKVWV